jgi:hypothetical protein
MNARTAVGRARFIGGGIPQSLTTLATKFPPAAFEGFLAYTDDGTLRLSDGVAWKQIPAEDWILDQLENAISVLPAPVVVTYHPTNPAADFSTLSEAFNWLSRFQPSFAGDRIQGELKFLAGAPWNEPIVSTTDLGWVKITSEDATVPVIATTLTRPMTTGGLWYPALEVFGRTPLIATEFVEDGSAGTLTTIGLLVRGGFAGAEAPPQDWNPATDRWVGFSGFACNLSVRFNATVRTQGNARFRNARRYSAWLTGGGLLIAEGGDWSGAGLRGLWAESDSMGVVYAGANFRRGAEDGPDDFVVTNGGEINIGTSLGAPLGGVSQPPWQLRREGVIRDARSDKEWGGTEVLTPEMFCAVGDGTALDAGPVQAMFDESRNTGKPWRAAKRYNLGDTAVTCYTSGDGSGGEFVTSAAGQGSQTVVIAPVAADALEADAALATAFNGTLPLARGAQRIPALAPWVGQMVRLQNATPGFITGTGGVLRFDFCAEVLDDQGHIWPPLPYDVPAVTFTASAMPLRPPLHITLPQVTVASGTTDRTGGLVRVDRPRVSLHSSALQNNTTATISTGFTSNFVTSVKFFDCHVSGLRRNNTQYGWNLAGSSFQLIGCSEDWCRRGLDSTYGCDIRVEGGTFPDGIGAHIAFGLTVHQAAVGTNDSSQVAFQFAGWDLDVTNCDIATRRTVIQPRTDNPIFGGRVRLSNNRIAINLTGSPTADTNLIRVTGPGSAHAAGVPMKLPELIDVSGNVITVSGAASDTRVNAITLTNLGNLTDGVTVDGIVRCEGNRIISDAHDPRLRIDLTKFATCTGLGWRVYVRDAPRLALHFFATSGASGSAARATVYASAIGDLNFRRDFGALLIARIEAEVVDQAAGNGLHAAVGDEEWAVGIGVLRGEFGLGGIAVDYSGSALRDWNLAEASQLLGNSSNSGVNVPVNGPPGDHCWGGTHIQVSSVRAVQVLGRVSIGGSEPAFLMRSRSGDNWTSWVRFLHNGMTLPTTQPATPNTFWRDSANGNVVKLTPPD